MYHRGSNCRTHNRPYDWGNKMSVRWLNLWTLVEGPLEQKQTSKKTAGWLVLCFGDTCLSLSCKWWKTVKWVQLLQLEKIALGRENKCYWGNSKCTESEASNKQEGACPFSLVEHNGNPVGKAKMYFSEPQPQLHKAAYRRVGLELRVRNLITGTLATWP